MAFSEGRERDGDKKVLFCNVLSLSRFENISQNPLWKRSSHVLLLFLD
jgi:hypothetical protein